MTEFSACVGVPRPRPALAIIMQHIRRHFVALAQRVRSSDAPEGNSGLFIVHINDRCKASLVEAMQRAACSVQRAHNVELQVQLQLCNTHLNGSGNNGKCNYQPNRFCAAMLCHYTRAHLVYLMWFLPQFIHR